MAAALFVLLTLAAGALAGLVLAWSLPAWLFLLSAAMMAGGVLAGHSALSGHPGRRQP